MSFAKLCPSCDNNATCKSPVPINVLTHDQAKASRGDAVEMKVSISGFVDESVACYVFSDSVDEAIRTGATRLVFEIVSYISNPEIEMLSAALNCRMILKFNHQVKPPYSLEEIRVVCEPGQVEAVNKGLAKLHPRCFGCFERKMQH